VLPGLVRLKSVKEPDIAVGTRIRERLDALQRTEGWLAEQARLERSTIWRIINGRRTPTPTTLATIAPILGLRLDELVAGTDAATRVEDVVNFVARTQYEAAVGQIIKYERLANDAVERANACRERADREETRRRSAEARADLIERERDDAREAMRIAEKAAERCQESLLTALSEVGELRTRLAEVSANAVESRKAGRAAAVLAGLAATASAATYFAATRRQSPHRSTSHEKEKK
jgi:transcriptional regulator with XRE-family HTH domain